MNDERPDDIRAEARVIKKWHGGGGVSYYLELAIGAETFVLNYESGDRECIDLLAEQLTAALKSAGARTTTKPKP